jgi:hypothetical protein
MGWKDYSKATGPKQRKGWGKPDAAPEQPTKADAKGRGAPKAAAAAKGAGTAAAMGGTAGPGDETEAQQKLRQTMADLLKEADALDASAKHLLQVAKGLDGSSEADQFRALAEEMCKKASAKREARKALKPDDQVRTERERDLAQKREKLVKAKKRLSTTAANIDELEDKLAKLKAQQVETEQVIARLDDAVKKLYTALGRQPDDDDDGSASEDDSGQEEEEDEVMGAADPATESLRQACATKPPAKGDDELKDDWGSVTSAATGGKRPADGVRRSRSPPARSGVERNF